MENILHHFYQKKEVSGSSPALPGFRKWEHAIVLGIVYGVAPGILLSIAVCVVVK